MGTKLNDLLTHSSAGPPSASWDPRIHAQQYMDLYAWIPYAWDLYAWDPRIHAQQYMDNATIIILSTIIGPRNSYTSVHVDSCGHIIYQTNNNVQLS